MKFLIQRVSSASVHIIDTDETNEIGAWFVVYVWVHRDDIDDDRTEKVDKFVRRVDKLELFSSPRTENIDQTPPPSAPPLNRGAKKSAGLRVVWGELLVISNFTLYGRNKKAWSVDFTHAAKYDDAEKVYDYLIQELRWKDLQVQTWEFGAMMEVSSVVVGPVNMVLEW